MQLYDKIQLLRKENNLTQSELAEKLNVSRQAVQKWEAGTATPDVLKLPELAKIFNVTIDYLLDNDAEQKEENNEKNNSQEKVVFKTKTSSSDMIFFIPLATAIFTFLGMWFFIGGIIVGMLFIFIAFLPIAGVISFVLMFLNLNSGTGSILIYLSMTILGLSLAYPTYLLSFICLRYYKKYSKIIIHKIRNYKFGGIN
ncbi:helix-turn-helix transcriptional regulator [Spiroplasma chinense]|uniref:Helix-turn-helix transcriptional regulator n=1 Tax=Spiroplasma chinense TaxID=216932 RepID=A0A5B9Y543_9MOLU|nr:helix-turn-helix transcriptional regulator [Spiroplasma chinense]QEH61935.1 helix-turn-helix transcriptional regulator [Spiroplasma chinense]